VKSSKLSYTVIYILLVHTNKLSVSREISCRGEGISKGGRLDALTSFWMRTWALRNIRHRILKTYLDDQKNMISQNHNSEKSRFLVCSDQKGLGRLNCTRNPEQFARRLMDDDPEYRLSLCKWFELPDDQRDDVKVMVVASRKRRRVGVDDSMGTNDVRTHVYHEARSTPRPFS